MKYILSLLIVLAAVTHSYAQDEATMPRPITKAGSCAWMFTVSGLESFGMDAFAIADFNLPSFTGSITSGKVVIASTNTGNSFSGTVFGAGGKYYLSDGLALRILLGFSNSSDGDPDPVKSTSGKTSSTKYGIAAGIEMHTHDVYSISPYFGAQISFAGLSGTNTVTPSGGTSTETKASGTALGIGVLAGFDWYFTNALAVGGEYTLGFSTGSGSTTLAGKTTDVPSSTSFGIGSANVHLIVHM